MYRLTETFRQPVSHDAEKSKPYSLDKDSVT